MEELKARIAQLEFIRNLMVQDLIRVKNQLDYYFDINIQLSLLTRSGKLYDQIIKVENSLRRDYKELDKLKDLKAKAKMSTEAGAKEKDYEPLDGLALGHRDFTLPKLGPGRLTKIYNYGKDS